MTDLEYCTMFPHLDARNPEYGYKPSGAPWIEDEINVSDRSFDWHENPMTDDL